MLDGENRPESRVLDSPKGYNAFGELGMMDILDFGRRYGALIAKTVAACVAVALIYILMTPSLYTARGELLIDAKVPLLTSDQWTETAIALDTAQVESQIAVLMSEHIAMAVAERLNLITDSEFGGKEAGLSASNASTATAPTAKGATDSSASDTQKKADFDQLREIAAQLQSRLKIRRLGLSYVIEVSFTSQDPEKSARIANALMESYIADQIAVRADAARQGSEWLEMRINTLRARMNAAALKVQEFKARRDYRIASKPGLPTGEAETATSTDAPNTTSIAESMESHEELESTALTYRKMFESALQAYTEAEQRQSYPVTNARIISTASPPVSKSSPKRMQALALSVVAGVILGFGIALLTEGLNSAKRDRRSQTLA